MKHPYNQMPLPFYEGDDPQAGTPMSLLMEGATGYPLAGVPVIAERRGAWRKHRS
jgi:hypothetical protein